jgi:adenosylmethionine-8-amino-7-oxononanoate aminotransferase
VRDICDRYDILLILDEIMCGVGRTGTMHAWEQEGISPDIQTVAKGLGGGYVPIGAVMMNKKVFKALDDGSG